MNDNLEHRLWLITLNASQHWTGRYLGRHKHLLLVEQIDQIFRIHDYCWDGYHWGVVEARDIRALIERFWKDTWAAYAEVQSGEGARLTPLWSCVGFAKKALRVSSPFAFTPKRLIYALGINVITRRG